MSGTASVMGASMSEGKEASGLMEEDTVRDEKWAPRRPPRSRTHHQGKVVRSSEIQMPIMVETATRLLFTLPCHALPSSSRCMALRTSR